MRDAPPRAGGGGVRAAITAPGRAADRDAQGTEPR